MDRSHVLPILVFGLGLLSCGGASAPSVGPEHADLPIRDTTPRPKGARAASRESPPPPSAHKESPFPKETRSTLVNGLTVISTEAHALPLVELRLNVHAGMGYAGAPAVAEITAELLKDGGTRTLTSAQLIERVEMLGATLSVDVRFDATTLGLAVTKDRLGDALALLGEVVQAPRFDEGELKKLKGRESDDAADRARADGTWTATRILFRELFPNGGPYATYEATPGEIAKVSSNAVRDFHHRFYVPKNAELVVAGDVEAGSVRAAVERAFGAWTGGDPPKLDFAPPSLPGKRRVVVAHRPKSSQSDVYVVTLAPERKAASWPEVRVANQVLGGGTASRLFADVREQRSLAYNTRATITELGHGRQPLLAYAGTQTAKTALAVQGILDNFDKIATQPIGSNEVESARRYLSDIFAVRLETVGAVADMVSLESTLGLPSGYWDQYRAALRGVDASQASRAAADLFQADRGLIVVAGDADAVAAELARFGDVTVVDPEHDFTTLRTIPKSP